jgi:carbon-monoxide dehydrogenase large subunit
MHDFPADVRWDLEVTRSFTLAGATTSYGTHLAVVEVDLETGGVSLLGYFIVEDCGTIINQAVVDGQIRGGVVQGIGSALFENVVYDADGQILTTTLMDYVVPGSTEVVPIRIRHLETPSPLTPTGSKGVGESGTIASPAAIANAVSDALAPFGVSFTKLPITASDVLEALKQARRGAVALAGDALASNV